VPEPERSAQQRATDLTLGAAVTAARAGAAAARLALLPARLLLNAPLVAREARASEARMRATGQDVVERGRQTLAAAAEDALDGALAGPAPETIARALADHRVLERIVESPAFEHALVDALRSPAAHRLTDRVIESPELEQAIVRVGASPAVRRAVARQTKGFADELGEALRRRAAGFDDRIARERGGGGYAGLVVRGLAFAIDLLLVAALLAVGGGILSLLGTLVDFRPAWLVALLVGAASALVESAYFVLFWTVVGRTPGMHVLGIRVLGPDGRPPRFGRAVVRLVGTWLAIVPLFAGFLPVLFDRRRRALQDYLAGTTVVPMEGPDAAATAASTVG
jgi:uncharacterized RDD family membrane protein YckC